MEPNVDNLISRFVSFNRTMALALSQTRQLPREVTRSISHRAFPRGYRSTLLGTLVIFKARATVNQRRPQGAGHLPVVPVIARQVIRAMGPATRRTLMLDRPRSVNETCDLSLTVSSSCCIMSSLARCQASQTESELVHKTLQMALHYPFCCFRVFGLSPSVYPIGGMYCIGGTVFQKQYAFDLGF